MLLEFDGVDIFLRLRAVHRGGASGREEGYLRAPAEKYERGLNMAVSPKRIVLGRELLRSLADRRRRTDCGTIAPPARMTLLDPTRHEVCR